MTYTHDNPTGYTDADLSALNTRYHAACRAVGIDLNDDLTEDQVKRAQYISEAVLRRYDSEVRV